MAYIGTTRDNILSVSMVLMERTDIPAWLRPPYSPDDQLPCGRIPVTKVTYLNERDQIRDEYLVAGETLTLSYGRLHETG